MNETDNFPGQWQGTIPEELKSLKSLNNEGLELTLHLSSCIECLEHLAWPVYKPLERLKILDPACGTGEILLPMAMKYPQISFTAWDLSTEALAQAQQYAEELEIENINFVESLPETGDYHFILATRPLQHIEDLAGFLNKLQASLAEDGLFMIHTYTGSHPEDNLYLQERVAELKAGSLNQEQAQELIKELLAQPLQDHIDGVRECNQLLEKAGFKLLSGLHPRCYEPARYLPEADAQLFSELSLLEKTYLAEQICGMMLRHTLLYVRQSYQPETISFYDPQAARYIPHLSPYAGVGEDEDRVIIGLKHHHLLLVEGIEFEDLSLPVELFRILQAVNGKMNCEQIHRRFLPMPWERFWALIQACWEEEIIYLHRR